jgi:uncharacterized protein YbjT (DUF2867 family)
VNPPLIAVIGGSGKVGRHVVAGLRGTPVRALARTQASAAALDKQDGVEVVRADLDDPSTLPEALKGADRLFIATPYHPQQGERERAAIQAAGAAGVRHVVKVSSYAAGLEPEVAISRGHKIAERALRESAMSWTALRPDWWFDNLLLQLDSLRDGTFFFPAHGAVVTALDARDLADVAVAELLAEHPYGGVVNLTGPETLGFEAIAARLAAALGRPLTFADDISPAWPPGYAQAVEGLFAHYRGRGPAPFTHTVAELLGRHPRSVEDFGQEILNPLLG